MHDARQVIRDAWELKEVEDPQLKKVYIRWPQTLDELKNRRDLRNKLTERRKTNLDLVFYWNEIGDKTDLARESRDKDYIFSCSRVAGDA